MILRVISFASQGRFDEIFVISHQTMNLIISVNLVLLDEKARYEAK